MEEQIKDLKETLVFEKALGKDQSVSAASVDKAIAATTGHLLVFSRRARGDKGQGCSRRGKASGPD